MDKNGHSEPPSILPREITEVANGEPSSVKEHSDRRDHDYDSRHEDRSHSHRHRDSDRDRDRDRHSRRSSRRERSFDRERERERPSRRDRDRDHDRDRRRDRDQDRRREYSPGRDRHSRRSEPRRSRESRSPSDRADDSRQENIVPLHLRKRQLHQWDVRPPGYDGMTCEQVKATGHFPLPGHIGALKAAGLYHGYIASGLMPSPYAHPLITQGIAGNGGQTLTLARQARRLYVGNIPYAITEGEIERFFNATMKELNIATSRENPVVSVSINHDKNYAFVEFRDPEETSAAMAFDGINFQGQALKIRRPKEYQGPVPNSGESPTMSFPGVVSTNVQDTPHKLFIGGLPPYLNEEQVMELLKVFGELKSFNLVKDVATNLSKGFAFCEYADPSVTDLACQGLNNMELGDKKLLVQRASIGASKPMMGMNPPPQLFINAAPDQLQPTRILLLLNMVTPEELEDDEEYEEILTDIEEESSKFGKVLSIKIPRDRSQYQESVIGKVFIEYDNDTQCAVALKALAGRKFSDRIVLASYYPEEKFLNNDL